MPSYELAIITGGQDMGGTDATVHIQLIGTKGTSEEDYWVGDRDNRFERGKTDNFTLNSSRDPGELNRLLVWHDNKGKNPGWFLNKIMVTDESKNTVEFRAYRWLATDEADGETRAVLGKFY